MQQKDFLHVVSQHSFAQATYLKYTAKWIGPYDLLCFLYTHTHTIFVDTKKFLLGLELVKPTMSLAGIESTALSPRLTSHALLSEEERQAQGITEQMVRFSAGIEAIEDIKRDLLQSIAKIK